MALQGGRSQCISQHWVSTVLRLLAPHCAAVDPSVDPSALDAARMNPEACGPQIAMGLSRVPIGGSARLKSVISWKPQRN